MYCLKPGIKKGFLNDREKIIISLAQKQNLPASVVSMNLTNRTATQVRNAYRRNLSNEKDIFKGGWLAEEDKLLLSAVNPHAPGEFSWSQVAKQVPGRNAEQCRHRFNLIKKKVHTNPNIMIENFPRVKQNRVPKKLILPDEYDLQENFKQNRLTLKNSNEPIETVADRKLRKSFLDNDYITKHCNFSSKCYLLKYILDYLGADLVVPKKFVHLDDLMDEGLMSMMAYLQESSIEASLLKPNTPDQNSSIIDDTNLIYEGIHDVLRTSDIINSDISELNGLFDIRMRNSSNQKPISSYDQTLYPKKKPRLPQLCYLGSIPPNYETFKMLYTFTNNMNSTLKVDSLKDIDKKFNWNNKQSKKLHLQLVAIFRWPALFSGMVDYNAEKINLVINTEQTIETNHSSNHSFYKNKKTPLLKLKKLL